MNKCFLIILILLMIGYIPATGQVANIRSENRAARHEERMEKKERRKNHSKKEKRKLKKAIKREEKEEAEEDKIRHRKIIEYMRRNKQN